MDKKIYYYTAIRQMPRLLGQLDRNKNSRAYGCFDRNYWHYKITDFPSARHQEAVLTLALLYKLNRKDNPYFKNSNILKWINASLKFWCNIQNRDGSFNEWYPNERSFAATGFSSYAVSECLIILDSGIEEKSHVIKSLRKSGDWMLTRNEWNATNQTSGIIASLFNIYILTKDKKYLRNCQDKLGNLIGRQSSEGWWNEYNGADIGFLSLTIDYLSKLFKKFPNKKLKGSISRAIDFLSYFVHPNMTFGGEYGSRNTEYLIPHGIELNAGANKNAAAIASAVRNSLKKCVTVAPYSVDDRYLCYITYVWLQSYLDSRNELEPSKYKFCNSYRKNFPKAKVLIISNKNFYAIINYSKGGAFSLCIKNGSSSIQDSGIMAVNQKDDKLTSSWIAHNKIGINQNSIVMQGKLWKIKNEPMTAFRSIGLRLFAKTFGSSQKLSSLMKNSLRKRLITSSAKSDINFTRQFIFEDKSVKIIDSLASKGKIKHVFVGEKYSSIFIPSSRYFQLQELNNKPLEFVNINKKNFSIERVFTYKNKLSFKADASVD